MFPFNDFIKIDENSAVPVKMAHDFIGAQLTPERLQKIKKVVEERTFNVSIVLEDIYDRGNASAVLRSAEALGFGQVHMIEPNDKFKESQRTTAGADKWVEITKWKKTADCIAELKRQGKQVIVTHLSPTAVPIDQIDFSKPSAIVFGNEKDGASDEMIKLSDACVVLPMTGFVQSYNISVAAALTLYQIFLDRKRRLGQHGDLNDMQKMILEAQYYLRTISSGVDQLRELVSRRSIENRNESRVEL